MNDIDDREIYEVTFSEVCLRCRRFHINGAGHFCDAFPDGIPDQIWNGNNKHVKPYPGDRGIRFDMGRAVKK